MDFGFSAESLRDHMVNFHNQDDALLGAAVFTATVGAFFNKPSEPGGHIRHAGWLDAQVAVYIQATPFHLQERS